LRKTQVARWILRSALILRFLGVRILEKHSQHPYKHLAKFGVDWTSFGSKSPSRGELSNCCVEKLAKPVLEIG